MTDEAKTEEKEKPELPSSIANARAEQVALRHLMASEGWKILARYCTDQRETRVAAIMSAPVGSQEEVYKQEYMKAEAWTFHTFAGLPKMLVDTMQDNVDIELQKLKEEGVDTSSFDDEGDLEGTAGIETLNNAP